MNPITNALLRLSGIAPLVGPIPLSEKKFKDLFSARDAFVDYFPITGFEDGVFTFDDDLNVGIGWELTAVDLDAKPAETLSYFNDRLAKALVDLPQVDEYPYTVQFFLQNAEVENTGYKMREALPSRLKNDKLSNSVCDLMVSHTEMLSHEEGAFLDSRSSQEKGWRVSTQKAYLIIYRVAPESYWKKNKRKTPTQQLISDTKSVITGFAGINIQTTPLDDYRLIEWLAPVFSGDSFEQKSFSREKLENMKTLASYDVGQKCFDIPPQYHRTDDPFEQGIFTFGSKWMRYLTTSGLQKMPNDGCLTISTEAGSASVWEQFPPGSMITWTIVPQSKSLIDSQIDKVMASALKTNSDESDYTREQGMQAKQEAMRNNQRIFYVQIGAYLSSDSKEGILNKTSVAIDVLKQSQCLEFIQPNFDLFSQDSFIRALPFVYDFQHDRNNALRSRMTYLSHLSATLPLFGVGKGSNNPCFVMYKRSGEVFTYNPYLKSDRQRVAHQMVFGPTGAGKSATMINLAMMSMAMNGPRQFILDKGNSFGLLADYYEAHGKKVRRYTFNAASTDSFPPFYETDKALKENAETEDQIYHSDDEEKRSYIAEMTNSLKIMVTGGKIKQAENLEPKDLNFLQKSLIAGLKLSKEKNREHAIITDIHEAMHQIIKEETIDNLAERFRGYADGLEFWLSGPRGRLFNQIGGGFDEDADLTIIETGSLADEGSEDMFAVAGLATLTSITALGEKLQYEDRHIEVYTDEGHYWLKLILLINGLVQATKVWRKLGIWLTFATQDFSDFPDDAKKILSQAENWLLLSMDEDEAKQISRFKDLTDEEHYLIRQAIIEKPNFTEATLLSKKFGCGLNRFIPPSLVLALAQTDKDEKAQRQEAMKKHNITELEAAYMVADEIEQQRRKWQSTTH